MDSLAFTLILALVCALQPVARSGPAAFYYHQSGVQQQQPAPLPTQQQQQQQQQLYVPSPQTGGFLSAPGGSISSGQQPPSPVGLSNSELVSQQEPQQQQHPDSAPQNNVPSDRTNNPIFRYNGIALNSTTVKIVWSLLSGYHAEYFDIIYGPIPDGTNVFSVNKINGTARDYIFNQLQPDTLYQFQLIGYRSGDLLQFKPALMAVRTPAANNANKSNQDYVNRDIMPLGVKAEAKSNQSIQLSWTEPDKPSNIRNSQRVNIIRYYINPTSTPSGPSGSSSGGTSDTMNQTSSVPQYHYLNITNPRESRLIVQKLKPATEYAFAVKTAYYSPDLKKIYTQSGFSMDTLAKTFDLEPSPPRNFTIQPLSPSIDEQMRREGAMGGKLELNWLPPESPNGQLKGYVILYANNLSTPDEKWARIEANGANINNWYVGNLWPGTTYYLKVRAINQKGQSGDSEVRQYTTPGPPPPDKIINLPLPPNNILMLIIICMVAILFLLFLLVSRLACRARPTRKPRKTPINGHGGNNNSTSNGAASNGKPFGDNSAKNQVDGIIARGGNSAAELNGFASTNSGISSTVAARVGTLARRNRNVTDTNNSKPDFWISAIDERPSEKLSGDSLGAGMPAMVSIQRDSPHSFASTQLAGTLPDYRIAAGLTQGSAEAQLLHQIQQPQSHYQAGHQFNPHLGQTIGCLAYDQMDNATASALMTLSKRQQQQLQKYQIQFAATGAQAAPQQPPTSIPGGLGQPPSPHQQPPPPPPPLSIEQQQPQVQQQPIYGSHQATRSLRLHRPTLYDPVSGSFVQGVEAGPPNYHSHQMGGNHVTFSNGGGMANTLQFMPHQTSTLLSRRSTNTMRSFQTNNSTYGQLAGPGQTFAMPVSLASNQPPPPAPTSSAQHLLQSHQAVINQLNNSTYPSLPLKHVSAVRPQIMSSLEDQIEMELAEKAEQQQQEQPPPPPVTSQSQAANVSSQQ